MQYAVYYTPPLYILMLPMFNFNERPFCPQKVGLDIIHEA